MKKVIIQFLFILLLVSCGTDGMGPVEEEILIGDNKPPQISINSFPEKVESLSTFQVNITDESGVRTKIYINNDLLSESDSKSISFEIDPFDYTIGNKTLKIVSTDSQNNENSVEIPFELKKLLFVLPDPTNANGIDEDQFLSVNFIDGSLYMAKKIENDIDGTFYANDDFKRQEFVVSLIWTTDISSVNYHQIFSFSNIKPGTILLSASERHDLFNTGNLNLNNNVLLNLNDIINPRVYGYNSRLSPSGGGNYFLGYNNEAPIKYFLYSFPDLGNIKSDYSYALITDLEQTKYASTNLSSHENFASIEIPNTSNFTFSVEGYETESDFTQNRFNVILSLSDQTFSSNKIDVPLFPGLFEIYNLKYSYTIDDKSRFTTRQRNLNRSLTTNTYQVTKNGNNIIVSGDHDYSKIIFRHGWYATNTITNVFEWTYHNKESKSINIPFESFEIPEQVSILFEQRKVIPKPNNLTNDNYMFDFEVYNHSEAIIYENMMFGSSYNQNEAGDVTWLTYNLNF